MSDGNLGGFPAWPLIQRVLRPPSIGLGGGLQRLHITPDAGAYCRAPPSRIWDTFRATRLPVPHLLAMRCFFVVFSVCTCMRGSVTDLLLVSMCDCLDDIQLIGQ